MYEVFLLHVKVLRKRVSYHYDRKEMQVQHSLTLNVNQLNGLVEIAQKIYLDTAILQFNVSGGIEMNYWAKMG